MQLNYLPNNNSDKVFVQFTCTCFHNFVYALYKSNVYNSKIYAQYAEIHTYNVPILYTYISLTYKVRTNCLRAKQWVHQASVGAEVRENSTTQTPQNTHIHTITHENNMFVGWGNSEIKSPRTFAHNVLLLFMLHTWYTHVSSYRVRLCV